MKGRLFKLATGGATALIVLTIAVILGSILWEGVGQISWRFVFGGTKEGMFDAKTAGVFPMIFGTLALVILMTLGVVPVGVITAVYLNEYAKSQSAITRVIRGAINNLAGVPSIVFGLFGLGFFIQFVGGGLDKMFYGGELHYRKPALIWAAATMAIMTLPVVIVATEEALKAVPKGLRESSLALGATKLETIWKLVLPEALPGVLTGAILAVGRGAGEVTPVSGAAYYLAHLPTSGTDQFMHLGYHVFVLSTQSPDIERTKPILYGSVLVLLVVTFLLNLAGVIVRAKIRSGYVMDKPVIQISNANFFYGPKQALFDVNVEIMPHRTTAFIGPSGCGKSTLLRCLNRMNDLIDGTRVTRSITLNGQDLYSPDLDVIDLRKRVGMVFQKSNPFPKSIFDNIAYGLRIQGVTDKAVLEDRVTNSLKKAALWDEVKDRLHESALMLSGGQQQRLCIARAIAVEPEVVLMDEPCSALDPTATAKIEELIQDLEKYYTIIIVTHNMQQAARCSDFTAFFYLGKLVEFDATNKIFTNPSNKQTEDYVTGRFG